MTNLSPANFITVSLQGTPQGLAVPNINTVALISSEQPAWYGSQDYAQYKDATSVAEDFGSSSLAAAIANAFFSQSPNPIQTQGCLVIIPRQHSIAVAADLTVQDINYKAVATGTGGNSITIAYTTGGTAGSEVVSVVGNAISVQIASGVSTAQQIADAIGASVDASALVTATIYGQASKKQTAPVSVTNLSGGSASGTEPVHTAMVRTASQVYYFGVILDQIPAAAINSLAAYVQGQDKMLFVSSNVKADFQANGIIGIFSARNQNQVRGLYYNNGVTNDTITFAAAYASRGLSTDFSGNLTAISMHAKQLVGFDPDATLTQTDVETANANGVDVYPAFGFQGLTAQARLFTSGANEYFDQVYNRMWLKLQLQVAGFNYLAQASNKIPQTETGMDGLKDAYRRVLAQAISNGILAPGSWNSPTVFGNVANLHANIKAIGYYVYSLPVDSQLQTDREARKAPVVQIAAKEAGAIHSSSLIVQVNP